MQQYLVVAGTETFAWSSFALHNQFLYPWRVLQNRSMDIDKDNGPWPIFLYIFLLWKQKMREIGMQLHVNINYLLGAHTTLYHTLELISK